MFGFETTWRNVNETSKYTFISNVFPRWGEYHDQLTISPQIIRSLRVSTRVTWSEYTLSRSCLQSSALIWLNLTPLCSFRLSNILLSTTFDLYMYM